MTKSKFQKKKDREREVRKKILARREAHHRQEKENAKIDAEEKAVRPKQRPITNAEFYQAQKLRDMEIRMQLEHNMKLLEGLQKEYEEELKKREEYIKQLKEKCEQNEQSELGEKLAEGLPEKNPEVESIFEDCEAGFAPAPSETLQERAARRLAEKAETEEKARPKREFQKHLRNLEKKGKHH